jgi:hypothetical protein
MCYGRPDLKEAKVHASKKVSLYLRKLLDNDLDDIHIVKEMLSFNLIRRDSLSLRAHLPARVISSSCYRTLYELRMLSLGYEHYFERNMKE